MDGLTRCIPIATWLIEYVSGVTHLQRQLMHMQHRADHTPLLSHRTRTLIIEVADSYSARHPYASGDAAWIARYVARSLAQIDGPNKRNPFDSEELSRTYAREQRFISRLKPEPKPPKPAAPTPSTATPLAAMPPFRYTLPATASPSGATNNGWLPGSGPFNPGLRVTPHPNAV